MKMQKQLLTRTSVICSMLSLILFAGCSTKIAKDPVDYVDPYIGSISHLLVPTFPTVHLPNSMLRVYPERYESTENKTQ